MAHDIFMYVLSAQKLRCFFCDMVPRRNIICDSLVGQNVNRPEHHCDCPAILTQCLLLVGEKGRVKTIQFDEYKLRSGGTLHSQVIL